MPDNVNVARPLNHDSDERSLTQTMIDDVVERVWQQNNVFFSPDFMTMHSLGAGSAAHTWRINGDSPEDAAHHTPGQWIVGGTLVQDKVTITVDDDLIKAIRIPLIDDFLSKWDEISRALEECARIVTEKVNNRSAVVGLLAARASSVTNVHAGGYDITRQTTGATTLETTYPLTDTGAGYFLADLGDVARTWDGRNYPKEGRIAYVKPWIVDCLTESNKLMSRDYVPANVTMLHERMVGMAKGFQIVPVTSLPDNEDISTDLSKYNGDFTFAGTYGDPAALLTINGGAWNPVGAVTAGPGFRNRVWSDEDRNTTGIKSQIMIGLGQLAPWKAASISALAP